MKLGDGEGLIEETLPLLHLESHLPLSRPGESDLCPLSSEEPDRSSELDTKSLGELPGLPLRLGAPLLLPLGLERWLLRLRTCTNSLTGRAATGRAAEAATTRSGA
jgi:hypothetical protein